MAATIVVLPWAAPAIGQQAIITNTATARWTVGHSTRTLASNTLDIGIDYSAPLPQVQFYGFSTSSRGTLALPLPANSCATPPDGMSGLGSVWSAMALDPAQVDPVSAIHAGQPLIVVIDDATENLDPTRRETVSTTISSPSGDRETLLLQETAIDSGRFAGAILTIIASNTAAPENCRFSVQSDESPSMTLENGETVQNLGKQPVSVLIDPFGMTFDSNTGDSLDGARVTLLDDATGLPAEVFGDDGSSRYPSSMTTGETVTDSSGTIYPHGKGDYRFPLVRPGHYRLKVDAPSTHAAPSELGPAELARLRRPDNGESFAITGASYGAAFPVLTPSPVRVDIPLDRLAGALTLSKVANITTALPGDVVAYRLKIGSANRDAGTGPLTLTDHLPEKMRLRPGTVHYVRDNAPVPVNTTISRDGRDLTVQIPRLGIGQSGMLSYLLEIRPDARPGDALNRARLVDSRGATSPIADAVVTIRRDEIADRITIIGRIVDGGCATDPTKAAGVANVRVMLEDGTYTVSDADGRYHFAGVRSGLHVVQLDTNSLPADRAPIDCARDTRSGGSAISHFVEGSGGMLKNVDFRLVEAATGAVATSDQTLAPTAPSDSDAAGGGRDWMAGLQPGIDWLFPELDHNPRSPAVRVVIKHGPEQHVRLALNGKPVDPVTFEGTKQSEDGSIVVSGWRAVPIRERNNQLSAEIIAADGRIIARLERDVHFAASPLKAELLPAQSRLVADGIHRPMIALRLTDRDGRPVRHGMVGDFSVPAPYFPAMEADAQAARQLAGLERAHPVWRVIGDEGVAYIELEPTTTSGTLTLTLPFRDGKVTRNQRLEAWLDPGNRPWTIVGFAAGTAGFNTLSGRMEDLPRTGKRWQRDARLALYAKGRIKGKWLMTLAYDSDRKRSETTFGGLFDPHAYYTIYADGSEQRADAASVRKLYLRLERPQFYALFGDYATAIDQPMLARYVRGLNGLKSEYRGQRLAATAFAADQPSSHRREDLPGNGTSGPYGLASRHIRINSEQVMIEVRDRLRPEQVSASRMLTRHIDYDMDYATGTLRFSEPILSRSPELDPQYIVIDYEVDGTAMRHLNAGGRVALTSRDRRLTLGTTALRDEDDVRQSRLGSVDLRYRPSDGTELRAEVAASDTATQNGPPRASDGTATAWRVEAEHHGPRVDLLAYAGEQQPGFGLGQQDMGDSGMRRVGAEGRWRVAPQLALSAKVWLEDDLVTGDRRRAGEALIERDGPRTDLKFGTVLAEDLLADGTIRRSRLGKLGVNHRLFDNRLEIDGQSEFSLYGQDRSLDFPDRHRVTARLAVTKGVTLVGGYEISHGALIDARTARLGFDLLPWAGGRITASANRQQISEYGPRSFAAYGLAQSLILNDHWTIDAALDGNRTLAGMDSASLLASSDAARGDRPLLRDMRIAEDFTALSAGATWRATRWSWTGRAQYRRGDQSIRRGLTSGLLRELGEGRAIGAALSLERARTRDGGYMRTTSLALSWAHRPMGSRWAWLDKLEYRDDANRMGDSGEPLPGGDSWTPPDGNHSRRLINSLSLNWSPLSRQDGDYLDRSELSLFLGTRYASSRYGADVVAGWSQLLGLDARFDITDRVDLGGSLSWRTSIGYRAQYLALGPQIGIRPFDNGWITIGYNLTGFSDRDFEDSRYTRAGLFITTRLKFDQTSFAALGLIR